MASEEIRKKWGTIYMGNREASLEELKAMQEPLRKEQEQKEQAENYMERVRNKAADRAREILGAAYAERQKVLEEAKAEAAAIKRQAAEAAGRLKAAGEGALKQAQGELDHAAALRAEADKIRASAHEEGFQHGMNQAGVELQEFRGELGQALAAVLRALERERKNILENWREELAALVQAAAQAGTAMLLDDEHQKILRNLVFHALDLLENRSVVTMRVNPADEASVSDMFRAARERAPELKQWIVVGDTAIEAGGLVAETVSGSVDLQRSNFREMIDGILGHLGLPELASESRQEEMRDLVEREVAHIASLTPEPEREPEAVVPVQVEDEPAELEDTLAEQVPETVGLENVQEADIPEENMEEPQDEGKAVMPAEPVAEEPTLAELEEELFPLEEEPEDAVSGQSSETDEASGTETADPRTLAEGGFL